MALENGLLIHGPSHWAAAIRTDSGELKVASGRKPRLRFAARVPGLRGVVKLAEAMTVVPLVKFALPQALIPYQDRRVFGMAVAVTAGSSLLRRRLRSPLLRESLLGGISMLPALYSLTRGELASYHGAEHKTIGAYEQGHQMSAQEVAKEHERCGSHLVAPVLAANIAGATLLHRLVERPTALQRGAVGAASLAAAVEIFIWSEHNPDSPITRAIHRPGFSLQHLVGTREPNEQQLEVGKAALDEILRAEGQ